MDLPAKKTHADCVSITSKMKQQAMVNVMRTYWAGSFAIVPRIYPLVSIFFRQT